MRSASRKLASPASTNLNLRHVSPSLALVLAANLVFAFILSAQTPGPAKPVKTPPPIDLSGVWMGSRNAITLTAQEPPLTPWAESKFRAVKPGYGPHASPDSQDPILSCLPPGFPRIMLIPFPMQILQTPGQVTLLFEYDHFVRLIFTDRHDHPKDLDPTWMGDSIGRWEKDTLVVDTVGLKEQSWLDMVGHPHSDALHVVERIRRVDRETLQDEITIDDPRAYKKPWTGTLVYKLKPSWRLIEYVCVDNMAEPFKK